MSRALVLNASFEPLCVVSGRRAVVLVLDRKAEVVHASDEQVHSERLCIDVPSVIRLHTFVKVPYRRRAALNRRAVFARDHHRCQYCGARAESIDHVVPRSKGGPHAWDNVVAACRPCNTSKRDRMLADTSMTLRRRPEAPEHLTWVIVSVGHVPEDWHAYLGPVPDVVPEPALSA
jgi:5-methylcytosine-specific restriction endonuclease McrA